MVALKRSLKRVFSRNTRTNIFLPSRCQVRELIKTNYEKPCNIYDWYNNVKHNTQHTSFLFTSVIKKGIDQYVSDQDMRAETIINKMKLLNKRRLVTMDGHGRFLLSFVHKLIELEENLCEWNIELIDIDEYVHKWHELYLPQWVLSRSGNIMDIATPEYLADHNAFLYMNFCGVGNQYEKLLQFILNMHKRNETFMLSYSKRGVRSMEITKSGKKH